MAAPGNPSTTLAFIDAVTEVFASWTALQLAVNHGAGGLYSKEKGEWLPHATDTWFSENANLSCDEVEDFLSQMLDQEFNTIIEDNSLSTVSQLLCQCYSLCSSGHYDKLRATLASLPKASTGNSVQQVETDDLSSDEACMATEGDGNSCHGDASDVTCNGDASENRCMMSDDDVKNHHSDVQNTPSTSCTNSDTSLSNQSPYCENMEVEEDGWTKVTRKKNR